MGSEKTPNLGLNQIDRTSPKTTYFDLEKYLDQNWRAVDDFAGGVNDGVNAIKKRLDTTERKTVTLEPGLQIVHAEKAAPFSLTGLSGRTLVNLLGRWGNLSSLTGVLPSQSDLVLDTSNKGTMLNSLKVTIKSGYTAGVGFYSNFKFLAGKYYVAIAKAKVGNATNAGISLPSVLAGTKVTDRTKFTTTWLRFAPTSDVTSNIDLIIEGTEGQYSYFEAVRIYEISASEYAALAEMTGEQIDAKYPYVDSVMPVRNPYAIRYGENLLPPFYEWKTTGHKISIDSPYSIEGELLSGAIGTDAYAVIYLDVIPNKEYTITNPAESTGKMRISTYNSSGIRIQGVFINPGESRVIRIDATAVRIGVHISGVTNYTNEFNVDTWSWPVGTKYKFYNPILNIGNTAKPFKPREDSMLAIQTDLYADPVTGANADTVFERDGQYFKTSKWQGLTLDGGLTYALQASRIGYKNIEVSSVSNATEIALGCTGYKYDGQILVADGTFTIVDRAYGTGGKMYVTVSSADSGWGDSYTPTADEIKAYFMGWVMYDGSLNGGAANPDNPTGNVYNGTGSKAWCRRKDGVFRAFADPTATLPTTLAQNWTPYELIYQLATPTVEPIVSEGQLSFIEEDNQVEVGTGLIVREGVKPSPSGNNFWINGALGGAGKLRERTSKILAVYRNGKDNSWTVAVQLVDQNVYGVSQALTSGARFDQSAIYSVTYLMLDKSPVASFVGSYAVSEKSLLADLVESVQQNVARVSVLENKKADKDNPAWITPTLLNGWTAYSTLQPVGYYKDVLGIVRLRGMLKSGPNGSAVFRLPDGYKPSAMSEHVTVTKVTTGAVAIGNLEIAPTGIVIPYTGGNEWLSLDGITFLADQ
ncbi:hypothetical protein ACFQ5D_03365 [Paenibacillus farraposensis]|uniref:Carbohydrate binding domain-containing protein n=1 Tax=Paenibacillus farraposensis TaxID=2807095 RepID=A0ABW4D9P4_9BACL|nr:hypothetical protein [Paenibacillus farraposensis]MCC3382090.1 hypothetical protein [Paenibacillus farraposensis]